jgi:hypothetical protein
MRLRESSDKSIRDNSAIERLETERIIWLNLLEAAETLLAYFDFDKTVYGDAVK